MKICPNCGRQNADSAKFCKYCGTKLTGVKPQTTVDSAGSSDQIHCPNCGALNKQGAKFCMHCGFPLSNLGASPEPSRPADRTVNPVRNPVNNGASRMRRPSRVNMNQVSQYGRRYFQWLVKSLKHPLKSESGNQYFGLTSFVIEYLCLAITVYLACSPLFDHAITADVTNFAGFLPFNVFSQASIVGTTWAFIYMVLFLIDFGLYWGVGYLATLLSHPAKKPSFWKCGNQLAWLTNGNVILFIALILAVMIGIYSIVWLIMLLIVYVLAFGLFKSVDQHTHQYYLSVGSFLVYVIAKGIVFFLLLLFV